MRIERPVFIVGTGRCGSTLLHNVLATHPGFAWLSAICDRQPNRPWLQRAAYRLRQTPWLGPALRGVVRPGEAYHYWEHHQKGFSRPCRDLTAGDVTNKARHHLRAELARLLSPRRCQLLIKITGWPRIGFLDELFPDARFVHIIRDGRAVANSLVNVDFWDGWQGPRGWTFGELPEDLDDMWQLEGRSFLGLAAIQWMLLNRAVATARRHIDGGRFLDVRYEDFCADPVATSRTILKFAGVLSSRAFEQSITRYRIRSTDDQWKSDLTAAQQEMLDRMLHAELMAWEYVKGPSATETAAASLIQHFRFSGLAEDARAAALRTAMGFDRE